MAEKMAELKTKPGLGDYFEFLRMTSWINIVIHTLAFGFYTFLQARFFTMAYANYQNYHEGINWQYLQATSVILNGMITSLFVVLTELTLIMSFKLKNPKYLKNWRCYAIISMSFSLLFALLRDTPIEEKLLCWILIAGLYVSAFNMAAIISEDITKGPPVPDVEVAKKPLIFDT